MVSTLGVANPLILTFYQHFRPGTSTQALRTSYCSVAQRIGLSAENLRGPTAAGGFFNPRYAAKTPPRLNIATENLKVGSVLSF